jgi:acyl-CoA thioester hydrolase
VTVPLTASVELVVPFHDVDSLHVVWHGHYMKYMEIARQQLLRERRLDVTHLMELGVRMLVTHTHLKHVAPLCYNDRFRVTATLVEYKVRFEFQFEIFNLTRGKRAATGRTILAVVGNDGELCFQTPSELIRRIEGP